MRAVYARGDREREAGLQVRARAPQGGRRYDEQRRRNGGARGRGRVRGRAARDLGKHRAWVRAACRGRDRLVWVGYREAGDACTGLYGA